jgi:phenylalanyl-tRNA synthetase beta chain
LCHPKATRDISGIVDEKIETDQIFASVFDEEIKINQEIKDIYKGNLPKGKKSITITITLQHPSRTLNTQEINKIINDIIKNLSEKIGWEERK